MGWLRGLEDGKTTPYNVELWIRALLSIIDFHTKFHLHRTSIDKVGILCWGRGWVGWGGPLKNITLALNVAFQSGHKFHPN